MWAPALPKYTSYFLLSLSTRNIILVLETDASVFKAPIPRDRQRKWGQFQQIRSRVQTHVYVHTNTQAHSP